jgi:hypothetical protein
MARRPYNNRANSNPNHKEPTAVTLPKPPVANPFIPSSVQAKRYSTPTKPKPNFSPPDTKTAPNFESSQSMEQQLKRMLNLDTATAGVADVR